MNWKTCATHGPDKPGVWGCPECLRELREEIEHLRAQYNAQCQCADEWADKYRAERSRKADATLLGRVAELERALAVVNAELSKRNTEIERLRDISNREVQSWGKAWSDEICARAGK